MAKRVAIVGAGCTGLGAIKCCLEEGLEPVCFESASDIGGLWRYTDDIIDGRGSVMSTTVINTSKEMMSFSDFPPPREFPNFMHHTKVLEYFRLYANKFSLLQYIQFNTDVVSIKPQGFSSSRSTSPHQRRAQNNDSFTDNEFAGSNVIGPSKTFTGMTNHTKPCMDQQGTGNRSDQKCDQQGTMNSNDQKCDQHGTVNSSDQKCDQQGTVNISDKKCDQQDTVNSNDQKFDQKLSTSNHFFKSKSSHKDGPANEKTAEFDQSTHWVIHTKDKRTNQTRVHYFDCVLICTGHHADVNMPRFPGQSKFKGRVIHSRDMRRANEVTGSRHVVVGIGNSGCDVAVELSRYGQVYLSTRRGTWLMQRLQRYGWPADVAFMSRLIFATALKLPHWVLNKFSELYLNKIVDHSLYGLRPKHGPFDTHPTVNDELPNRIASGHVVMKANIDSFTDKGVQFEDGAFVEDVDTVIMATGYKFGFPFLDQSILAVKDNQCPLYLHMFPPTVAPPTLAVIGCVQPGGALVPVCEMQCRLATRVFKDAVKLPSQQEMERQIAGNRRAMGQRYIQTQRHTIQADFLPYMDQLAAMIGCKPKLGALLLKDPHLAMTCFFGPCTSYQYRLTGPGARPEARATIMTQMERVRFPFRTRPIEDESSVESLCNMALTSSLCLSIFMLAAVIFIHYLV